MSRPAGGEPSSLLIVRLSALGDIAHVLPSVDALRALYPRTRITWAVEPLGAQLLEGHPHVDRLVVIPRQRWKREIRRPTSWPSVARELFAVARDLRRERFDVVLDFQGSLKSAAVVLAARARRRAGFHRGDCSEALASFTTSLKAPLSPPRRSKVEKNLALVRALGYAGPCPEGTIHLRNEHREWARALVASLEGSGPAVALHPAVSRFGEIKRWPAERYRDLADGLRSRLDARVLITWGPGEREVADAVGRPTVLPEEVGIQRFAAILEAVDLVVAGDTGALPIASILGTPTVGLYGPKDPAVYAPHPRRGEVVRSTAPCSPCKLRRCEHCICMSLIGVDSVLDAAARALASRVTPGAS